VKSLPETFPSTVRCGVSFPFVSMAALKARRFGGVFANRHVAKRPLPERASGEPYGYDALQLSLLCNAMTNA
jgi:hypothetical protein